MQMYNVMSRMNEMPVADGNLKDEADTRLLELTIILVSPYFMFVYPNPNEKAKLYV